MCDGKEEEQEEVKIVKVRMNSDRKEGGGEEVVKGRTDVLLSAL